MWHLCHDPHVVSGGTPVPWDDRYAVFISNARRAVWMRHQRAGDGADICWDYHVVLVARGRLGWDVWDQDCVLGMPLRLERWLQESFLGVALASDALLPTFRVVAARRYVDTFSSDRRHMLDEQGVPLRPAPPWPAIARRGVGSNLMRFVDMTRDFEGEVLDLEALQRRFGGATTS